MTVSRPSVACGATLHKLDIGIAIRARRARRVRRKIRAARSGGAFGRPSGNAFPILGFFAPPTPLPCTENPRVDGSIPSLATISNWCIPVTLRGQHQSSLYPLVK
jgi:hypothetical protein